MPKDRDRSFLPTFAILTSAFALLLVVIVAAAGRGGKDDTVTTAAAAPVAVQLSEFSITPKTLTLQEGGSLDVANTGSQAHNFSIEGQSLKTPAIAPGAKAALDTSKLAPGTYPVFCAVAGHKDSGMIGTLTVANAGSAAVAGTGQPAANAATGDMAGMPGMGTDDLQDIKPGSDQAKSVSQKMEKAMTGGVNSFLDYAKKYAAGQVKAGNAPLQPKVLPDGTKEFDLTAAITDWEVSPGKVVKAWTYNGIVPGPWIKVSPNDKVKVVLHNNLPISSDIHFHGVDVPFEQDGLAPITQDYIASGATYTYTFTASSEPKLGMYHAHMHGQVAIVNGLFAIFQVGDTPLPKAGSVAGIDVPANLKVTQEIPMVLNDAGVIGLTLNGKAFPETAPMSAKPGEWVLMQYFNEGLQGHPMHLHRLQQLVVRRTDTRWPPRTGSTHSGSPRVSATACSSGPTPLASGRSTATSSAMPRATTA